MEFIQCDLGVGVRGAFTTRRGGVSESPWTSLNLGLSVGDDTSHVAENWRIVSQRCGSPVAFMNQVHGADVIVATEVPHENAACVGTADALVTVTPGLALAVLVADCMPLLLADAENGIVAVAHAGRKGLFAGVIENVVAAMGEKGAQRENIVAVIGPSICGECYEVPSELRDELAVSWPVCASTTSWGTPALDLPAGAELELTRLGVGEVHRMGVCTRTDSRFFSYRESTLTGRFAGIITLL